MLTIGRIHGNIVRHLGKIVLGCCTCTPVCVCPPPTEPGINYSDPYQIVAAALTTYSGSGALAGTVIFWSTTHPSPLGLTYTSSCGSNVAGLPNLIYFQYGAEDYDDTTGAYPSSSTTQYAITITVDTGTCELVLTYYEIVTTGSTAYNVMWQGRKAYGDPRGTYTRASGAYTDATKVVS